MATVPVTNSRCPLAPYPASTLSFEQLADVAQCLGKPEQGCFGNLSRNLYGFVH